MHQRLHREPVCSLCGRLHLRHVQHLQELPVDHQQHNPHLLSDSSVCLSDLLHHLPDLRGRLRAEALPLGADQDPHELPAADDADFSDKGPLAGPVLRPDQHSGANWLEHRQTSVN